MYKVMMISGENIVSDYKKRVYLVNSTEMEHKKNYDTFVIRYTVDGIKILKSTSDDRMYLVN